MTDFLISLVSLVLFLSASMVILSKDPLHSVLYLISSFTAGSGLLFLLENEFFALFFLMIYLGAIAVLFLFVVMMLNIKYLELQTSELYLPAGALLGLFTCIEILAASKQIFKTNSNFSNFDTNFYINWFDKLDTLSDLNVLSQFFYTQHAFQILIAGVILYIAVIGVSLITVRASIDKHSAKSQNVMKQIARA